MIHPHTELCWISEDIGYGVVATHAIPRGTITWVRDPLDQTLSPERVAALGDYREILERYCYVTNSGEWILCWDLARYINHSCEANCLGPGYDFEIAIRDIEPGEQLTDDYAGLNITEPFRCCCGSEQCRGTVHASDFHELGTRWDEEVGSAFPLIGALPQPLWPYLAEKDEVLAVLGGRLQMRSGLSHALRTQPLRVGWLPTA
ncbi:MAG: SET domain-containing protein [Planctomycetota bacterium]|jgi:hypothetical protein